MKDIRPVNPSIYPSPNPCGIKIPFYIKERKIMETRKDCSTCDHSYTMCGELICRWHEAYVSPSGKCSWWVKKEEKK